MKATVIQEFRGAPDGDCYPRIIKVGEEVTGELAQVACAEGWAKKQRQAAPKKPHGSASASPQGRASRKKTAKKSED